MVQTRLAARRSPPYLKLSDPDGRRPAEICSWGNSACFCLWLLLVRRACLRCVEPIDTPPWDPLVGQWLDRPLTDRLAHSFWSLFAPSAKLSSDTAAARLTRPKHPDRTQIPAHTSPIHRSAMARLSIVSAAAALAVLAGVATVRAVPFDGVGRCRSGTAAARAGGYCRPDEGGCRLAWAAHGHPTRNDPGDIH